MSRACSWRRVRSGNCTASRGDALQSSISPRAAKRHSNPCQEDFGVSLERAQGKHGTGRPSAEFPDIHGKSPQPYPSLERDNFAELRRSVHANVLFSDSCPAADINSKTRVVSILPLTKMVSISRISNLDPIARAGALRQAEFACYKRDWLFRVARRGSQYRQSPCSCVCSLNRCCRLRLRRCKCQCAGQ